MLNSEAVGEPTTASKGRIAPFGKYLLLQRVSVGGMAEVFKAIPERATRIDQIIAIKRILPSIAEDREFIGMFIDEARVAGQLNHPNICRMYELGRVGSDHYIAMQFLWGRDLLKVMNRYKKAGRFVSPSLAAFVGAKALSALHYAHTKRDARGRPLHIIHRDVSPQNIIVGYSGHVKLIDFGVARAATQSQKTQAGILKGKFGYMSPEMVRGLPIDHRSDVFAMGICLHELLTSSRLFYGETDFATLELVRDAKIAPPSAKAPGVPPALDAIVMKALSREADDRYQSAEEMQRALEAYLDRHDPQYGQAEVAATVRQAFQVEVQRERERLDVFWKMLERGELVRGASIPASLAELGGSQPGANQTPHTGVEPAAGLHANDDPLHDEQTHIFFSADELDEVTELRSDRPRLAAPATLSDLIPPPLPHPAGQRGLARVASSGTFERAPSAPPARPTQAASAAHEGRRSWVPAGEQPPGRRPSASLALYAALFLMMVTLGLAIYAMPRFASPDTGALAIDAVGDPDALVRLDGVVRGNPPVLVEDLAPGVHRLEIQATGYEVTRADVTVEPGETRSVRLVLEKDPGSPTAVAPGARATGAQRTPPSSEAAPAAVDRAHDEQPREPMPSTAEQATRGEERAVDQEVSSALAQDNQGELLISTVPWSRVFIDGIDTERETPVRALRVTAGAHRVGLRTPDDVMHELDVVVKPGQTVRIIRRF